MNERDAIAPIARVALVGALLAAGCPRDAVPHAFNYLKMKSVPDSLDEMLSELDEAIAHGRKVANV